MKGEKVKDAFGKALMAYYMGGSTPTLIRRDDGHLDEHPLQVYFSTYAEWPEYEREALKYVRGRVLDIGCGAGRHSLWLQDKGLHMVAMDVSPLAIKVTQLRGVKNCMVMSATELCFRLGSFDSVLLLGNNFGVAGNVRATKGMLKSLYEITSESGRIITTSRDVSKTSKPEHLRYHEFNRNRGRPIGQITIRIEYKGEADDWFDLLMTSKSEMEEICRPAGWEIEKVFEKEQGVFASVLRKRVNEL